jgi:N-acetylglucosamine-6-phosphate deacetylase
MCGTEFIVEDGVAKLKSREAFAGSVATADVLIRTLKDGCGCSITDAVRMLTENPARLLGLNKGIIAEGSDADVIAFDEDINVSHVFVGGNIVDFGD